jgi:hypothetical protein
VIDLTKFTPEERVRAESFASDSVLSAVLDSIIAKYIRDWRDTSPEQAEDRERAYQMLKAVEALRDEFSSIASDQKVRSFNKSRA